MEEIYTTFNQPTRLFDLEGMIRTTTTVPTHTPTKVEQQVIIYIDDLASPTTKRLYIYSNEAGIWNYVTLT